jgi:hypothetical protein
MKCDTRLDIIAKQHPPKKTLFKDYNHVHKTQVSKINLAIKIHSINLKKKITKLILIKTISPISHVK